MDTEDFPRIDTPSTQLPDLTELGIEEVDRGVCQDTYENRSLLRAYKYNFRPLFGNDGEVTGLIEAISPEQLEQRALANLDAKSFLLERPDRKNSDYIGGDRLLASPGVEDKVPAWVLAATRKWVQIEDRRENGEPQYRPSIASAPGRCRAILSTGLRCQYWHGGRVIEDGLCRTHLTKNVNREAQAHEHARVRVKSATLAAVDKLERLLNAASEPVQLKAATEILDRAGIRGGTELDQKVTHEVIDAGDLLAKRLHRLEEEARKKDMQAIEAEIIEDAEVVEDDRS
jgi:hypothetical protein